MSQTVEVEIFGQHYAIAGEGDEAYVRQLARYVDGKMRHLAGTAGALPTTKLALLAAINITHELFQGRNNQKTKETFVHKKTKDLIDSIDQQFADLKLY
jgi:cell division protein ZapA